MDHLLGIDTRPRTARALKKEDEEGAVGTAENGDEVLSVCRKKRNALSISRLEDHVGSNVPVKCTNLSSALTCMTL